jgi:hypothetical protein
MKKIIYLILCSVILFIFTGYSGCNDEHTFFVSPPEKPVEDDSIPQVTELPWLNKRIATIKKNLDFGGVPGVLVRVYQCTYDDGNKTGFLFQEYIGSVDIGYGFYSCEGELLCGMGGCGVVACPDSCQELNIVFTITKLIWSHKVGN